ncbi:RNA-guided endonuclease InsQ/TnpB family protein [Saccharolobus solfataricus]|uniref:Transposase, IS605 OrfB family n=1 Tax=Saccharolobus solfataricus TaxID=2287 RepID=A0A157SZI4_SACSO|nr:RNA-guided endonuclease TnpB family protein [Saccharolobus solfataricus]SAI84390.1 transposase, IS605 OrfB family [Saccharolobus solfataricus]
MAPSSGQLLGDEEREPTPTPAMPEEGVYEVKYSNRRTNVVRLLPNGFQERKLRRLANLSAKLFNEVNFERRQQFFHEGKVDFKGTWNKYYEKYKAILGVNAQAVLQKNNEAWSSFFSLLKLKKERKLPPHMNHVSPPRYWKDREAGKRKLILVVRQDRYKVDAGNHKLILKDFDMEIDFVGRLKWYGKQGRLEIIFDETKNAWYAHIPIEVGVEETGKKSKHVVKGERKSIQISKPKGNKVTSIDLGINVIASVVVNDGTWLLYKGVRTKEDYFYFQRRISEVQSLADRTRNIGEYDAYLELLREKRRFFKKLTRRLLHLYRNLASHLIETLYELGVSTIYLGYPFNIVQEKGNKFTVNMWSYRKLMESIELKAQEYGMKVFEVVEYNTSKYCAYHDVEVKRNPRGVVNRPLGHKLHSDLNGALNILKKALGVIAEAVKKPLSFIVDHNRVAPIKGCNP